MNTLEAMLAVMMMIALVSVVMNAHSRAAEALGDEELLGIITASQEAGKQKAVIALGESRGNGSYARWYVGKRPSLDD
ncbi:hypothetical protein ACFLQ2_02460 [archaeon]